MKNDVIELDELWSFVYSKDNKRWVWVAICRRTRQIVACFVGNRGQKSCRKFWKSIPDAYRRCRSYSDYWKTYAAVITTGKHHCVSKNSGQTNHGERWNNTLRQRIGRFVRQTLSFSKCDVMHKLYLKLLFITITYHSLIDTTKKSSHS